MFRALTPRVHVCPAEKTIDYCSCEPNYNYTLANGTVLSSQGGCIQDDPSIPAWCLVVEKTCSQPPPSKPNGQKWDVCRGEQQDAALPLATIVAHASPCQRAPVPQLPLEAEAGEGDQQRGGSWVTTVEIHWQDGSSI